MIQKLELDYGLPGFNDYLNSSRKNKYLSAKIKKETDKLIYYSIKSQGIKPVKQAKFDVIWIEKNKKRNKDNIAFAIKFIFDSLQMAKIIKNDGWSEVISWSNHFYIGSKQKVFVFIDDLEKKEVNNEANIKNHLNDLRISCDAFGG